VSDTPVATNTVDPDSAHMADVVIVGAGPAGSTAGILLARAGKRVTIVDKATFPRDKCCGDGLTTLALRELAPLGLTPAQVPNWQDVREVWLRSPSGREVRLDMPGAESGAVFAATTPRRELDMALLDMAKAAGATVLEGHALAGVEQHADHVVVALDQHAPISARHLVAADGMWSPVRKALGLHQQGYLGEWHAVRQYARNVTGPAAHRLYVWFEPDFLPGYAWSFPLPNGRANIGYGVMRDGSRSGKDMKAEWAGLLDRPHIRAALGPHAELEDRHTAWPIPAGIDEATLTAGRVLFVGDAARSTDVMTGEGIGQAILTGRLAAEAIINAAADSPAAVRRHYERAVRHHLFADHRMSKVLNRWLASERLANGAIRLVGRNGWTRRNFVRWMFEDEPRAVLFTPRRWHRRFFRLDAPYSHG
jgi:geranylgeranyl reductase family protein